tara:strand:+ start:16810 stop:18657 length:1848 start_codon:yes stop_codon:yes gene_type:complete
MPRALYIQTTAEDPSNSAVRGVSNHIGANAQTFVFGDDNPTEIFLTDALGSYHSDSGAAGVSVKLAIVTPGSKPTGGTYVLTHGGNDTAALAYNANAAAIEAALDGLASVAAVTVTGTFPCYVIEWDAVGAQTDFSAADATNLLTPDGAISIAIITAGDGSTKEKVQLNFARQPHAQQATWTQITNGWSANFSLTDRRLCDLLAGTAQIDTTLELEITDAAGLRRTYLQTACVLKADGIKGATFTDESPAGSYTSTEADSLFAKKAQNLADLASAATSRTNLGISAANTPYTPAVSGDWSSVPAEAKAALDELADRTNGISATKTEIAHSAPSAAGSANLDPTDAVAVSTFIISPTAGSGTYTYDYILQRPSGGELGQIVNIQVVLPASENPTIRIYDEGATDSAGDDVLEMTFVGNLQRARTEFVQLVWDNTNSEWDVLFDSRSFANGQQTIWIPAASMVSRTTAGAASGSAETTTNKIMAETFDFDTTTQEHAQFQISFPKGWDAGVIFFRAHWLTAGTSGTVYWGLQATCIGDNTAIDTAFGAAQEVIDSVVNADRNNITGYNNSGIIVANASADALCVFQVYRNVAADTLAADAKLLGIELLYVASSAMDD